MFKLIYFRTALTAYRYYPALIPLSVVEEEHPNCMGFGDLRRLDIYQRVPIDWRHGGGLGIGAVV